MNQATTILTCSEMQEAWELLGQRLEALLSDGNITVVNFGNKVA